MTLRQRVLGLLLAPCLLATAVAAEPAEVGPAKWDLKILDAPPKFRDAPVTEEGVRGIFYDGLPFQGQPTQVFAWLGLPKDARPDHKVPGIVLVHGGGGTAHARWVRLWNQRGFAAIAMDTCGRGLAANEPNQKPIEHGGPPGWDASFDQLDWPVADQWTYHAVADVVLAQSLLRSLPEVDAERIGLTGISWGGYLTCIAASVDSRFRFAAPVYGCGFLGEDSCWLPSFERLGHDRAERWLGRWDPAVYLPQARLPLLWVSGDQDFAYPLGSLQKSYRLPAGERYLAIRRNMPHGHPPGETPPEILTFARQWTAEDVPLARVTKQGLDGDTAWAEFAFRQSLVKAELAATKDAGPWQKRQWTVAEAQLDRQTGRVSATVPNGVKAYYFMLFDDRGCVASSEHVERP